MTAPACLVFIDKPSAENVAQGHVVRLDDRGEPAEVARMLTEGLCFAYPLNRFEAGDAAAAFVAANKPTGGGLVRLVGFGLWGRLAPRDCRYLYVVQQFASGHVSVRVYCIGWDELLGSWSHVHLWDHPLKTIGEWTPPA